MEEVISVIVPVYNGARYIQKCVESIRKNTYQNLEIIIVNDGSKDNSLELLNELARRDERIQVYSKENGGIASAREFGLQKATGKYLCFVDQDDIVYSNAYETLKNNMEHFNSDLCIASFHCLRGKKKQLFSATQTNKVIERNEVEKYLFQIGNCIMHTNYHFDHQMYLISVWNCMYKREIVEKNHRMESHSAASAVSDLQTGEQIMRRHHHRHPMAIKHRMVISNLTVGNNHMVISNPMAISSLTLIKEHMVIKDFTVIKDPIIRRGICHRRSLRVGLLRS